VIRAAGPGGETGGECAGHDHGYQRSANAWWWRYTCHTMFANSTRLDDASQDAYEAEQKIATAMLHPPARDRFEKWAHTSKSRSGYQIRSHASAVCNVSASTSC